MVLIDTCVVYRWLTGTLNSPDIFKGGVTVSSISIWELHIKNNTGKLVLPCQDLVEKLEAYGFKFLNVTPAHAQAIATLPNHHKDPFDRMLIAQAICEKLPIATSDGMFGQYPVEVHLI